MFCIHLDFMDNGMEDMEDSSALLSALIFAVSRFLVSENCVAITTRHRLIMKNDPTYGGFSMIY